jgi:hypothetical protein
MWVQSENSPYRSNTGTSLLETDLGGGGGGVNPLALTPPVR